ncbi:hypothetical protein ABI59_15105 [Acidobacteria bacterium Mor1]|nr:hypothetical protein ABI59_15105 [Acidobacteria bacterium Mor1]
MLKRICLPAAALMLLLAAVTPALAHGGAHHRHDADDAEATTKLARASKAETAIADAIAEALADAPLGAGADGQAEPTPAQQAILQAGLVLEKHPEDPAGYVRFAMANARRARETADGIHYLRADAAIDRALGLRPDDFNAMKARTWVLLGRHEFAAALAAAEALHAKVKDDLQVYGFLVDAHVELGNYAAAEEAAQWMLNLRPGNVAGLTRAAYLREIYGDLEGSIELMRAAYSRTDPSAVEDRAWMLVQLAHLHGLQAAGERPASDRPQAPYGRQASTGSPSRNDIAEELLDEALRLFPGYHYALAEKAELRRRQGRFDEAVTLRRQHLAAAPHPENWFYLGEALSDAGRRAEAGEAFARFEQGARREMQGNDNANRELVRFYLDHAGRGEEALRIARAEAERRADVQTRGVLAYALYRNGEREQAAQLIDAVLAVGTRDPQLQAWSNRIATGS